MSEEDKAIANLHDFFITSIRKEMAKQGMTQGVLSKRIGYSSAYVSQLFNGKRMLNLKTLAKIQEALGIKFETKNVEEK
ncbi:MAG TPA: hypothetical protein DHV29_08020 [Bacteroidales bacterium]|nr:hypothetical protein [Bacteroidales bacterium]HCB60852.1 hypothetical protein [Bacteroidales bacterium]HCY23423.1 hypothetical protein [Bacteroidales bacterium]